MNTIPIKQYRSKNYLAGSYLIIPVLLFITGAYLSQFESYNYKYWMGQLLLGVFFFQCFILLHETGHYSFFKNPALNTIAGHLFAFISFIPFHSWTDIHNLHHRWTGWRDKDPTTEGTVKPAFSKTIRGVVNFCWWFFIPVFTIGYRYGNYWSIYKLKKYIPPKKLTTIYINISIQLVIYVVTFYFFGHYFLKTLMPGYIISLIISDLFILSQHSHIPIPVAGNSEVKPIRYSEQVKYTRSIYIVRVFAKLLWFNFNLHELHHAYPGLPAYHLDRIKVNTPNKVSFLKYLADAKKMKGMDFIFSTSSKRVGQ